MITQRFDQKNPLEVITLTFDYINGLGVGEILTGTPIVTCVVNLGTDNDPSAVLVGAPLINSAPIVVPAIGLAVSYTIAIGCAIQQEVQGGLNQVDYLMTSSCATTNSPTLLALNAILPVRI